ncbi:MAG: response regulator [Myxococcota bacterium]|nr:response regulator [Myxococcota bacterium]
MAETRYTLLFVDDEPDVLEILSKTFERRFNVLTASSGPDALALLRASRQNGSAPIDVLITDQKMPEMTGIQLAATVRAEGFDFATLLLTGYTDPDDLIAAINQGQVYRYITKPWDVNDLLMTVKNAVEFTQLRRDKERLLRQLNKRVEALSVLYEVSHQSAGQPASYDLIIDRVLEAVARVLPYDAGAALVAIDEGRSATLRLRCPGVVGDKSLLWVKDSVLAAYRKQAGHLLPEDQIITRVTGTTAPEGTAPAAFASVLTVQLVAQGRSMGTLSLFSHQPQAYPPEDVVLLDTLANQTVDAIRALKANEDESRRRIERMVESMADGVLLTDEKNQIVVINPAARQMLHLSEDPQEATTRHLQETLGFYPFELVRGWEYGGSQVLREELKIFDKTLQSTVTPVFDGGGALRGVCVVLRDITEQKLLEERKDEFVSIVSHELRTPLTSISGALDLVLNFLAGDINDKQQRYLAMAKDSTDKLNAIVDDLLDISKFAKGRMRMSFELACLDELVSRAVEKYGPALMEKRIRLTPKLPTAPLRALADPNRITQVLHNLLTNAVKFTPEGGDIVVELSTSTQIPGYATLTCWNSGEGIPEPDLERIFERFEQARTERTRTVRGTGLGLSICRSIVEAHGGRIWAEPSTVGGAKFVVVVPVEPSSELLDPETTTAPEAQAQRTVQGGGPPPAVLVVEDEPETAYAIKALLLAGGYRVAVASHAEEAVILARKYRPTAIILDVRLPGRVDGLSLAEILRHDPETRNASLLVISSADERTRAMRQGASAFLQKPLQGETLLATVEALLKGDARKQRGKVLVVDDDEKIAAICEEVLSNMGYAVSTAGSLAAARRELREKRPDVLLLDVSLPDGEGFTFLEELKAERASSHLSVIFISARTETSSKIKALKLGGDDYLTKPFDALELGARVESVMRRRDQELSSSPTTQLPGSGAIEREVQRRLRETTPFAFCYLDLDNLKAYNDYYGFAKADGVVKQTGDLLREVIAQDGLPGDFLGHVAGDDFVFIVDTRSVDTVCRRLIEGFDRIIPLYYDRQDRDRGYIEAEDRFGELRKFPIMSVSIVAVVTSGAADHGELARQAADLKKRAKAIAGSVYLRSDRELGSRSIA